VLFAAVPGIPGILGEFKGTPWDYQQEDSDSIVKAGWRMILGHRTGLGKTFISLHAASRMSNCQSMLITGIKSSIAVWMLEVPKWTHGEVKYISRVQKDGYDRFLRCVSGEPGVWLINHSLLRNYMARYQREFHLKKFKKPRFDMIIVDEAHKMKNRKSQLFDTVRDMDSRGLLFLTATPASRGAQDMWAYLHLLDPKYFPSYWQFVNTFCFVEETNWGKDVYGTRNAEALKRTLQGCYIKRTYEEVKSQLPPLRREAIELEMDPVQERLCREFDDRMILERPTEGLLVASGDLAKLSRLRQLALCPRVLDNEYPLGTCVDGLLEELQDMDPSERHIVVFSVYSRVLEVIGEELVRCDIPYEFLRGGLEPDEVNEKVARFKEKRKVMLCVLTFAQSFALDTVRFAYVIGADFDPINNIQAEGRLRRGDSDLPPEGVLIKYMYPKDTREMATKDIINGKVVTVRQFLEDYGS